MHSLSGPEEVKRIDPSHLPPLRVLIYRGKELIGMEELTDPRIAFVMEFDQQAKEFGLTARAI